MNIFILLAIVGFIVITAIITISLIKRPDLRKSLWLYSLYAIYYMGIIIYYIHSIILAVIMITLVSISLLSIIAIRKLHFM
ncbi:hypothetical protein CM19_12505 [Candidatus Acidianus copahuensis]|uniref:Sodium:proton antiporter n=1 Tax=Candidatus Acidianus copahuensis TaxID=1160895 RepID=A0A031LKM1_9CREN|nr:hypothetical protein [Candidatus Acidianus copahuensis]EZQ01759.1 hypothetical protein CM19_12505 [Candidatus Acidianus copahuensis]